MSVSPETPGNPPNHGHACECETSISLANHPHLVRMDAVPDTGGEALNLLRDLPPTYSAIGWYANYPEHYAGAARPATAEKDRRLQTLMADGLAGYLAAVKRDEVSPALTREFYDRMDQVGTAVPQEQAPDPSRSETP